MYKPSSKELGVNPVFFFFSLLFISLAVQATEPASDYEILAKRGDGIVTQAMFSARADKIPAKARLDTLRDGGRLQDVINTLLLRAQLAAEARKAGFQNKQIVIDRMQLAAEAELADAWMQHYQETRTEADYEQLAREYYQLHQKDMISSPKIDVSHILISQNERSIKEALELANSLSKQLQKDPSEFDGFVKQYSDDPSAASNGGKFNGVKKGDMVKPFEETAFALQEGEISEPVRTEYGYHIIRLDAHVAAEKLSFDDVKENLMKRQRKQHDDRISRDYLGRLTSLDVEMSEQQLEELINRLFGEDYVDPYTAGKDMK
jgi:parvulin-like peptidyl-prolyl isomerase